MPCRLQLDRLPESARRRQHGIAIRHIAEDPSPYPVMTFATEIEARIFVAIVTERDPVAALMQLD